MAQTTPTTLWRDVLSGSTEDDFGSLTLLKLDILRIILQSADGFTSADVRRIFTSSQVSTFRLLNQLVNKGWLTSEKITVRSERTGGNIRLTLYAPTAFGRECARKILG